MSNKILISIAVLGLGFVWGWAAPALPDQPFASALSNAYILWALFWGAPIIWRWRRSLPSFPKLYLSPVMSLALLALVWWFVAIFFFIAFGLFYCLCGGGAFHFAVELWKCFQDSNAERKDYRIYDALRSLWASRGPSLELRRKTTRQGEKSSGTGRYTYVSFDREK